MRPSQALSFVISLTAAALLCGCGARSALPGEHLGAGAAGADGGVVCADQGGLSLSGRVRDFHSSHPDFEKFIDDDPGIVAAELGADGEPVYAGGSAGTLTTTGQVDFDQWYHDVPGVNAGLDLSFPLTGDLAAFAFDSDDFFPIDGALFGDEGNPHNFHFTLELHGSFRYQGGEVFEIAGDDDLWLFVDKRLAIDRGGVHGLESGAADVDTLATPFGLVVDGVYPIDVFFAERHTSKSELHLNLTGPDLCVLPGGA
jgi:fibro-slime domain-containing protein